MSRENNHQREGSGQKEHSGTRKTVDILPSPEILEGYNYVVEGSAQLILNMFEREQIHRHKWEDQALRIHYLSTLLGQFLGFFIALSVFASAGAISLAGDKTLGSLIWIFGLAILVMGGLVWSYAKTVGQRPLFARPTMRTHFRPQKEPEQPTN